MTPQVGETARPIVLAVPDECYASETLQRAFALARAVDAPLHVVRVLTDMMPAQRLLRSGDVPRTLDCLRRARAAGRRTSRWCEAVLHTPFLHDDAVRVRVRAGAMNRTTIDYARRVRARAVFVPSLPGFTPGMLQRLARRAGCAIMPGGDQLRHERVIDEGPPERQAS
jgi:hypothetical protein